MHFHFSGNENNGSHQCLHWWQQHATGMLHLRSSSLYRYFHKKKKPPFGDFFFYGAGDEARTRYLHLGKVALYQMSYTREQRHYSTFWRFVNHFFKNSDFIMENYEKCKKIFIPRWIYDIILQMPL